MGDFVGFSARAGSVASFLLEKDGFCVVHHHDADGISAGAIIAVALERAGKRFSCISLKQLYAHLVPKIKESGEENFVFVDFGSGQFGLIKENFGSFCVIDHHHPSGASGDSLHLNPEFFGFSGGDELSGSGAAFLVAVRMSPGNVDLAGLAVVGAVGDMLDQKHRGLVGLSEKIVSMGVEAGVLMAEDGLRLYGRISRPLAQFLVYSTAPVFPGITASRENAVRFLEQAGIRLKEGGEWRSYSMLSQEEKKVLSTALVMHLSSHGEPEWKAREMFGKNYTLLAEPLSSPTRDAKEFATMLNACGRHGDPETGLAVCMGDRGEGFRRAMLLLERHRRELVEGLEFVKQSGLREGEKFFWFDAGEKISENIVGIVAGMLYGSLLLNSKKPIIAFAKNPDSTVKVSSRANYELVRNGLHLGRALKKVCAELGGIASGGGHSVAAGCMIEEAQKERFLSLLEEVL